MPVHGALHVQQRRQAWMERKKPPKANDLLGKCGGITAKSFQGYPAPRFLHKPVPFRSNQTTNKLSCSDLSLTSTCVILKMSPAHRSNALSQSLFLPPILGSGPAHGLCHKPISPHPPGTRRVGQEETPPLSTCHQGRRASAPSSSGLEVGSLGRAWSWEQKSYSQRQLGDVGVERKPAAPVLELGMPCVETASSSSEDNQTASEDNRTASEDTRTCSLLQQIPMPPAMPSSDLAARSPVEKSKEALGRKRPCTTRGLGEKSLWWDSAIESDSSSGDYREGSEPDQEDLKTHTRELESDQEGLTTLELEYYTTQRIIEWVIQVNRILFATSNSDKAQECPLTEQDTSIKIVYDGD